MAEGGCSLRRVRRHFADVQDLILTGRSGASSSESRPSEVGQELPVAIVSFLVSHQTLRMQSLAKPRHQKVGL